MCVIGAISIVPLLIMPTLTVGTFRHSIFFTTAKLAGKVYWKQPLYLTRYGSGLPTTNLPKLH